MPVIASNRLPITIELSRRGRAELRRSTGGLISALDPVLRRHGGAWVGWCGAPTERCQGFEDTLGELTRYDIDAVPISSTEMNLHYDGFCNSVLWPLFHGMPDKRSEPDGSWACYQRINRRFAGALVERTEREVWVHDYHLMLTAAHMRALGSQQRIGFFLHIPFPEPDVLWQLDRAPDLIRALLQFDLLGFQTTDDLQNFLVAVRLAFHRNAIVLGKQAVSIETDERTVMARVYPIGVASQELRELAASQAVGDAAREWRARLGARHVIIGVDRLDYSKGLPGKIEAFERFLEHHPERRDDTVLFQLVVPSRTRVPAYREVRERIDVRARDFVRRFGHGPLQLVHGTLDRIQLLGLYRAADVALVTPVRDGMNLVAKEYCAAQIDRRGALILSETAGAARQLGCGALIVDASSREEVSIAIDHALHMPPAERRGRLQSMQEVVHDSPVSAWSQAFLTDLRQGPGLRPHGLALPALITSQPC